MFPSEKNSAGIVGGFEFGGTFGCQRVAEIGLPHGQNFSPGKVRRMSLDNVSVEFER